MEGYEKNTEIDFYCEYKLNNKDAFYSSAKERPPIGPITINEITVLEEQPELYTPLVVECSEKSYLSILESDLFVAPEFGVINFKFDQERKILTSSNKTKLKGSSTRTPWRVILVNENLGDLLTCLLYTSPSPRD